MELRRVQRGEGQILFKDTKPRGGCGSKKLTAKNDHNYYYYLKAPYEQNDT